MKKPDQSQGFGSAAGIAGEVAAEMRLIQHRGERDAELQRRLFERLPGLPWEVTNQAAVHLWFESYFGHAVAPLRSLEEAVGSWPEYATSVALWLDADDTIHVIAPHGLDDLLNMVVRRNPTRASEQNFRDRTAAKRYVERWPRATVIAD